MHIMPWSLNPSYIPLAGLGEYMNRRGQASSHSDRLAPPNQSWLKPTSTFIAA